MSQATPSPIPDNYRRVTPCLVVRGAGKALDFYAEVFGATERMRFPGPDGTVAHAEIQIGDAVVIVEDEDPQRGTTAPPAGGLPGTPVFQFLYVEDVDAWHVAWCRRHGIHPLIAEPRDRYEQLRRRWQRAQLTRGPETHAYQNRPARGATRITTD
jgi:hypothetical protein